MDNLIILNQILEIDKTILTNSKKHKKENTLVEDYIYNQYDLLMYRKKFLVLLTDFTKVRNSYKFMKENYEIKITSDYDDRIIDKNRTLSDPVAKFINNKVDEQIKLSDLYIAIINLSCKFTYEESIYFINTFLVKKTEVDVAKIIGVTKPSIDKYKKSCLFKMVMDLGKFLEENEMNDY